MASNNGFKSKEKIWTIRCDGYSTAHVIASSLEEAIQEAARIWWNVPWQKVMAYCEVVKVDEVRRGICKRCGRVYNPFGSEDLLCPACREVENENLRRRKERSRAYYREAFGGLKGMKGRGIHGELHRKSDSGH